MNSKTAKLLRRLANNTLANAHINDLEQQNEALRKAVQTLCDSYAALERVNALMRERLKELLEVSWMIDDETKHQTRAIEAVLAGKEPDNDPV